VSARPRVSVTLSGFSRLFGSSLAGLIEAARVADAAGIDQLAMTDHVVMGERRDRYPYGRFPFGADEPWPEPLTTLAALAGATARVRLATAVLIAPLRPPVLLAKTLATLDALSGGRLDVGVGTGWQREEFDAAGLPFEGRFERMLDGLRACRVLWSGEPVSFASPTVSFERVSCLPRPVQPGGPPLWLGASLRSERVVDAISELGSGWMPIAASSEELSDGIARLRGAFRAAGRDPAALGVRAAAPIVRTADGSPDLDRTLAGFADLRERGATVASFALAAWVREPSGVRAFLEGLGRAARAA